jgi:hypothetical protein
MKKNNKGKGRQHINVLNPSTEDTVQLGDAVHYRFVRLLGDFLRVNGEMLVPPSHLDRDMILWREMMVRHNKRDFRNTSDEWKATTRIAQWTMDEKCRLVGKPPQVLQFVEP